MDKGDKIGVLVLCIIVLVAVWFFGWRIPRINRENCIEEGRRIGLPHQYRNDTCFIEIDDNLWVREYEVRYYLEYIDVERIER